MATIGLDDQAQAFSEIQQAFGEYQKLRWQRRDRFAQAALPGSIPVASLEDVLEFFEVADVERLSWALSRFVMPYDVDIYEDVLAESGEAALFVGLGHTGIPLYFDDEFPEDFAGVLGGIVEAADNEDRSELEAMIATHIEQVEGFRTYVHCRDWSGDWDLPEPLLYPFRRAAPGNWKVQDWVEKRANPKAPDWELWPRFQSGGLSEPTTWLDELRKQ